MKRDRPLTACRSGKKSGFFFELRKNKILFLMILPAIAFVALFNYIPMGGMIIAFKDFHYAKGIFGSNWCGFKNFEFLFRTGAITRVTINTVVYNILFILSDIFFQVMIAVFLSESEGRRFKKASQAMLLMPFFISWVVAGAIVYNLLSTNYGLINSLLTALGKERISFLNKPVYWPYFFVAFHVWKQLGYGSVVYLSAITGFDQELYEAADLDGARMFQRVTKITIPLLKPTIIVLFLLNISKVVKGDFSMFFNLTNNSAILLDVSDVIDTFVYRSLIETHNFGMSAAAGFYQSILGFVIIITVNAIVRRAQPEYALF